MSLAGDRVMSAFAQNDQLVMFDRLRSGAVAGVDLGLLRPETERLDIHMELSGHPGDHPVIAGDPQAAAPLQ
jgi:hypothetical protein